MITISNKTHWLIEQAQKNPKGIAVQSNNTLITYKELCERSISASIYLNEFGIRKNDQVGILFGHDYEFFVIVNAIWFIGAVPVPLNTRKTTNEIENEIHLADIKYLMIDDLLKPQFSNLNFQNVLNMNTILNYETLNQNFIIDN